MSNSNRMNQFHQRVSRKTEKEEISPDFQYFERTRLRRNNNNNNNSCESANRSSLLFRKSSLSRKSSGKKFAISSELSTKPSNYQSPKSLTRPIPPQSLNISTTHNTPCKMEPMRKSKTLPASLANSPNVEHIVQEFESRFMSPRSNFESGSGNFVKRIVAAFEEKYKTCNDTGMDRVGDKLKDSKLHRHSCSNICQSLHFASIEISKRPDSFSFKSSSNEALKVEYRNYSPLKIADQVRDDQDEKRSDPRNDLYLHVDQVDSGNDHYVQMSPQSDHYAPIGCKIDPHDPRDPVDHYQQRDPVNHYHQRRSIDQYHQKDPEVDHYLPMDHQIMDRDSRINSRQLETRNSQIDQYLDRKSLQNEDRAEDSTLKLKERAPIIIGAFLKKPVKVEEISVNWIPFPGKKLPRKKSLKKLLSTLSGKKSTEKKKEVVFSSQMNVNDENRELPDSGYDEQSLSSSSLTSITSTQEVTLRGQKNKCERIYANSCAVGNWLTMPNFNPKSTNLSTFQSHGSTLGSNLVDDPTVDNHGKKILLYEIPREEVKVDLGPCYPSPSKIMVKSLDRKCQTKMKNTLPALPKHPMSSRIPKHPFISLSKDALHDPIDVDADDADDDDDDDDDEVVLRKVRDSVHSSENEYDVPRKYLSRSEPGISDVIKFSFDLCLDEMSAYDVPKLRPKSSVYEDALSLKRRNADFVNVSGSSQDYYSSPSPPQYATIKSRNKRYFSPEVFKSADELRTISTKVTSF